MTKQKSATNVSLHHVGMFHGAEMARIAPLIRSTNFNEHVISECGDKGFIPLVIDNALTVAKFLARTILAAQLAHRTYGVPASVLIAAALYKSGMTVETLIANPDRAVEWPGCDCCYSPMVQKWFMDFAARLVGSAKGRKVLKLLPDRHFVIDLPRLELYVKGLAFAGFWDQMEAKDIIGNIREYGLDECDLAAIFQPNEYSRTSYNKMPVKGGVRLVPVWIDLLRPSSQATLALVAKAPATCSHPVKSKRNPRSKAA
jgi:hypothetical protein